MAQKAKKDLAKANTAALGNLHTISLGIHVLFLFSVFILRRQRSLTLYLLLSTPSFICEYVLERSGRPRYDATTGALRASGEDLAAAGLTEYMFDVVWVTWGCLVLVLLLGNAAWFLWIVVPAFGAYKGFGLFGMARQMAGMSGAGGARPGYSPADFGSGVMGGGDGVRVEGPAPGIRKQRRAA